MKFHCNYYFYVPNSGRRRYLKYYKVRSYFLSIIYTNGFR